MFLFLYCIVLYFFQRSFVKVRWSRNLRMVQCAWSRYNNYVMQCLVPHVNLSQPQICLEILTFCICYRMYILFHPWVELILSLFVFWVFILQNTLVPVTEFYHSKFKASKHRHGMDNETALVYFLTSLVALMQAVRMHLNKGLLTTQ